MKSPKPNDPVRLRVKGYGKPKAKYSDTITVPVYVEYSTWCCAEAHEYAHAFKCIADLFENAEEFREKSIRLAAEIEAIADEFPIAYSKTDDFQKSLRWIANSLRSTYGDADEDEA